MNILQIHNRYLTGLGGEDTVLEQEKRLLETKGETVSQLLVETKSSDVQGLNGKIKTAVSAIWSQTGYKLVQDCVARIKPDVVHVHNTFPLLSPSIYSAVKSKKVPVVQTLHNYRLICANALFMRDGKVCTECLHGSSLPALQHKCYKESLAATLPLAATRTVHNALHTYSKQVDRYIALTNFARDIFIQDGYSPDQIAVKPNFIEDPLQGGTPSDNRDKTIVFVGKLVEEKAVDLLIDAWKCISTDYRLLIVGDGPENKKLRQQANGAENIEWLGWLKREPLLKTIETCSYLVLPSRWFEGMPMVLLEAIAVGTPAIVPNLGAMPEIIGHGRAGYVFQAGDIKSLQLVLQQAIDARFEWQNLSVNARQQYVNNYTPDANYKQLMAVYESVIN